MKGIKKPIKMSDQLKAFVEKHVSLIETAAEEKANLAQGLCDRPTITKVIWAHIKKNSLSKGRDINPDSELSFLLGTQTVKMFEIAKCVSKHVVK